MPPAGFAIKPVTSGRPGRAKCESQRQLGRGL